MMENIELLIEKSNRRTKRILAEMDKEDKRKIKIEKELEECKLMIERFNQRRGL